jgi:hypothetical protein
MRAPENPLTDENRRIRLLRISTDLLVQIFMTSPVRTQEADRMIRGLRDLAATLFPGKEEVFDLIYLPRFKRALREAGIKEMPDILRSEGEENLPLAFGNH